MLKKISIRKLALSLCALFTLFLIYLVPNDNEYTLTNLKQEVIYIDEDEVTDIIYLMDSNNLLAMTSIAVTSKDDIESRAKELIESLIINGPREGKIPNGFKAILPSETKILSIKYENGLVKIDFSGELLDIDEKYEEKIVEAIVYTLTSIEEIKQVIIYVDGNILTKLPKTKINLPSTLDRSFGINKEYDITSTSNVNSVNIYYIGKYNDNYYYIPVTKYLNDDREKIEIVIENMSSNSYYNTNLMSFLNSNAKLLAVENSNEILTLTFNSYLFANLSEKDILEEVTETIRLSVKDNYDVKEVILKYEGEEIYKSVIKTIE